MAGDQQLPTPAPVVQPEMAAFWEATGRGELLLPQCRVCRYTIWYPRPYCPACGSLDIEWISATGLATVYSFTINRRGQGYNREFADLGPYVVAYVELDEGPRVLTNIVGCPVDEVHIGQRVRAQFDPTGAGNCLVRFHPADESDG